MAKLQTLQDVPQKTDGTTIQNAKGVLGLKNDFITINDVKVKLGESTSVGSGLTAPIANDKLQNDSVTVTAGSGLSGGGEVDLGASTSLSVSGVTNAMLSGSIENSKLSNSTITMDCDSGTNHAIALGETLEIAGGEGIDTSISNNTITVTGEEASTSNKGVASFSSNDFDVSSGAVTIKDGGVSNDQLSGSIANSKLSNSAITVTGGTGLSGGGSVSLGGSTTLNVGGLTNSELSGSAGITNANLANSAITINGTSVSLGASTQVGLTQAHFYTNDARGGQTSIVVWDNWVEAYDPDSLTTVSADKEIRITSTGHYKIDIHCNLFNNGSNINAGYGFRIIESATSSSTVNIGSANFEFTNVASPSPQGIYNFTFFADVTSVDNSQDIGNNGNRFSLATTLFGSPGLSDWEGVGYITITRLGDT